MLDSAYDQTPSKYEGSFLKHSIIEDKDQPRVEPDSDLTYLVRDYFEPILEIESGTELLKTELA